MFASLRRWFQRPRRTWQCFCQRIRFLSQRRRCSSCCPPRINTACTLSFQDKDGLHRLLAQGFFLGIVHPNTMSFPGARTFGFQRLVGPTADVAAFLHQNRNRELAIEVFVANVKLLEIRWFTCTNTGLCVAAQDFTICEDVRGYIEVSGFDGVDSVVLG